jgi:non-heme chloroperoxidase
VPRGTVNGVKLHYEDEGEGTPVVFVHGVWMSGHFFEPQRPFFRERHRSIVLDLRAHGASEHVHHGHTLPQYAGDLAAFLEALGLDGAVLVGWSMGALVVWDLIDQLGTGGIRGFVVVDQTTSDYKWPDWPHGMLDLDGLRHVMESVQTDRRESRSS